MLKLYILWGTFIAVMIGVVVALVNGRQRGRHGQRPPPSATRLHVRPEANGNAPAAQDRHAAAVPVTAAPRLMCLGASHHGQRLAIPPRGLSIGRAKDNDLVIVDGRISAHHAWIGIVDGRTMLRDYQSLNGTFLNADMNSPVSEAALVAGDTILFGGHGGEQFRLVVE